MRTEPQFRPPEALPANAALVVAFVALFAAMGGIGYSAVKLKPNSVRAKNIRAGAVTTDKIANGAVTTPKLAPDAVAPYATNAVNAMNAAKLGGVAPGGCQTGWLKASATVDTTPLNGTIGQPDAALPASTAPAQADDAVQVQREAVGQYTVKLADSNADLAIASSAGTATASPRSTSLDGRVLPGQGLEQQRRGIRRRQDVHADRVLIRMRLQKRPPATPATASRPEVLEASLAEAQSLGFAAPPGSLEGDTAAMFVAAVHVLVGGKDFDALVRHRHHSWGPQLSSARPRRTPARAGSSRMASAFRYLDLVLLVGRPARVHRGGPADGRLPRRRGRLARALRNRDRGQTARSRVRSPAGTARPRWGGWAPPGWPGPGSWRWPCCSSDWRRARTPAWPRRSCP